MNKYFKFIGFSLALIFCLNINHCLGATKNLSFSAQTKNDFNYSQKFGLASLSSWFFNVFSSSHGQTIFSADSPSDWAYVADLNGNFSWQEFYPWQVVNVLWQAQDVLIVPDDCRSTVWIGPKVDCSYPPDSRYNFGMSQTEWCGGRVSANLDNNSQNLKAVRGCGFFNIPNGNVSGSIKLLGRRPSIDSFYLTYIDSETNTLKTASPSNLISVCLGTDLNIKWKTSDGTMTKIFYGKNSNNVEAIGSLNYKPQKDLGISLIVAGYTGSGLKEISSGPINVLVKDCQAKLHCDPYNPEQQLPSGMSKFCMERHSKGSYCCRWPETQYNNDGCGPCGNPSAAWVDLKINDFDGPISVNEGEALALSWKSGNVNKCSANQAWSGDKNPSGNENLNAISGTNVYEINCSGSGGNASDRVVVNNYNEAGVLGVKVRLDGKEISDVSDIAFELLGPQTFSSDKTPFSISSAAPGIYTLMYKSGAPLTNKQSSGLIKKAKAAQFAKFKGYYPAQSLTMNSGQSLTFYLDFVSETQPTCNISVQAVRTDCSGGNSGPWTGSLSYALLGPVTLNGTAVNQNFENVPIGSYYLAELNGGPGTYSGVAPSNPISCQAGQNSTLTMKFQDCGSGFYKCNSQSGRCDSCPAYSSECRYSSLSDCQTNCAGCSGEHKPQAKLFCWANYNSDKCIGLSDSDPATPPVIISNRTSDPCNDANSCVWEILNHPEIAKQNNCSPLVWGDLPLGTYTAKISVRDSLGDSSSATQTFTVKGVDKLMCDFSWSPDLPSVNSAVSFFDRSLTPANSQVNSWKWTIFGGTPTSSTDSIFSGVIFDLSGPHSVTLSAKNSKGESCSITKEIIINKINPKWKETVPGR